MDVEEYNINFLRKIGINDNNVSSKDISKKLKEIRKSKSKQYSSNMVFDIVTNDVVKKGTIICRRHTLKKHGLTYEDYLNMAKSQEYCCKICNHRFSKSFRYNAYVDHDHKTGKVRALLCFDCNTTLGKFNDNITNIKKFIEYLNNYSID